MKIYLNREEQEKAIMLYLEKEGFGIANKTVACKFTRDTVEVSIDEVTEYNPSIALDEQVKESDAFFEEDNVNH